MRHSDGSPVKFCVLNGTEAYLRPECAEALDELPRGTNKGIKVDPATTVYDTAHHSHT